MTTQRIATVAAIVLIDLLLFGAFLTEALAGVVFVLVSAVWALLTAPAWVLLLVAGAVTAAGRKPFMRAYRSAAYGG
jgi:uncharacterized membrane protein